MATRRSWVWAISMLAVAAGALVAPALARAAFFASLEDVPLPPGFTERTGAAMAFEGAPGRILVAAADGPGPAEPARTWTVDALKGLGWSVSDVQPARTVLVRGREVITVEAAPGPAGGGTIHVRLVIRPAPPDGD